MIPLKIAIVCDSVTHFVAGAFVSTLRFAENLSERGHKVILITSRHDDSDNSGAYKNLNVYRLPSISVPKTRKKLRFSIPLRKRIKNILVKERINIVHVMVPTPLCRAAGKAAKSLGIRVVAHSHTQPENWMVYLPEIFNKNLLISLAYKYIINFYNKADFVVCPSKFSEYTLKRYGIKKPTKTISNGVDLSKFKKIRNYNKFIKRFGLSRKTKKLLFVGRLDPEKNISTLVKAVPLILKRFNNLEVCIVGRGRVRDEICYLIEINNLQDKVKLLGRISDEELVAIYNYCDIFVLPSLVELEGMVVLEAMACGKPILIADSKDSAATQFVKNNGFIFDPLSPSDLAEKSLRLLKNKKLLKEMAENSYNDSKDYSIDKSVSELEELYYYLLDKNQKDIFHKIRK